MGLRWAIPLPGPFYLSGRVFPRVSRSRWWSHPGCHIHHRSKATADACKVGRTVPVAMQPRRPQRPYGDAIYEWSRERERKNREAEEQLRKHY